MSIDEPSYYDRVHLTDNDLLDVELAVRKYGGPVRELFDRMLGHLKIVRSELIDCEAASYPDSKFVKCPECETEFDA
jgi:hypothetical protein